MNKSNIKIYISCFNNRVKLPDNPLLEIVQTGAANAPVRYAGVSHDDEGENISRLNAQFNDATTIYWAWKNCNNDYYGFMQYRRFLSFNEDMLKKNKFEWEFDANDDDAFEEMHLKDEISMRKHIESYDVLTCNYLQYDTQNYSLYDQYIRADYQHEKDLVLMFSIIQEKYPEYMAAARESIFRSGKGYFANCFIMKKEYFNQYCQFMFDVLLEYYEQADMDDYSFLERRAPGFLSERLLGIFITYLEMETEAKIGYLQKCFFKTTREQPIDRVFPSQKTAVVLAAQRENLPECSATVQSIIDHLAPENQSDIIILHEGISNYAIKRFCKAQRKDYVSIRFVNINSYFADRSLNELSYEKKQPYYCLTAADVLAKYDRCIWVPTGSVIRRNVLELSQFATNDACLYVDRINDDSISAKRSKKSNEKKESIRTVVSLFEEYSDNLMVIDIKKIYLQYANGLVPQGDTWFERTVDYSCTQAFSSQNICNIDEFKAFILYDNFELSRYQRDCALNRDFQARKEMQKYEAYFTGGKGAKDRLQYFVEDVFIPSCNVKPAFQKNNVAIGVTCSEEYTKYASVTIQSILENASDEYNYDILIFHEGISKQSKKKFDRMVETKSNVSIRYCMVKEALNLITSDMSNGAFQYSRLIYTRVLLGYLLPHYDQIIFVDCDMVVDTDLAVLANYDFDDAYLAAAHEFGYDEGYVVHTLMLKEARKFVFNAGFMVINLEKFRLSFLSNQLLLMCSAQNWRYIDQDVLNILCFKKVKYLEYTWNYRVDYCGNGTLFWVEIYWGDAFKLSPPNVYHYAGGFKPWGRMYSVEDWETRAKKYDDIFWDYAVNSPFYREIVQSYAEYTSKRIAQKQTAAVPISVECRPNLIRVDHPIRIVLDVIMPRGTKRRETVKNWIRWWRAKKAH